ncbi:putative secreted protein (Por secretion system target) [Pontibacter ummariensis]|uniref:Por secretion system C-terminal sorting domain-containing protein n=1 Tax=Pontibacter ummariensis TaxID=1610492 RepID=A0A239GJH2_9BACT|nr:T9SS type A sorting domain-containing protein [Pontibacter ummariensis]PRY11274.1 putative secreted protein (Por secretion system target) [Pontibacter ummariensis]SNS68643.1 Por secretion system C-terminal sorting domain-containing protein [Pontibacter ummariensis]
MLIKHLSLLALSTLSLFISVSTAAGQAPPAASVTVKIEVPESMQAAPFHVDRFATIPPNFKLEVYARVSGARFLATSPNGDLFVSMPYDGKVKVLRTSENGQVQDYDYVTGLARPHDIVFHKIGETQYVYISEKNQINRFKYSNGDLEAHDREIVVANLPDESLPELKGNYGHVLKNLALDRNHKLYVSIASTCNACIEDTQSDPKRGAIYVYDADGSNGRLFAEGLRNAEGLAFVPGTNDLWVTVNNRDQIAYPFKDETGLYGQVVQSYVDNNPPEEFTLVRDGGNYGWPFCNPDHREGMDNMPFLNDYQLNRNGAVDCGGMDRIMKGIPAHSAPLGLLFTQATAMPQAYRNGALIALHGSWNRSKATGYKVIFFPWENGKPGEQLDLVGGFLNSDSTEAYARPVDIAIGPEGSLFISDDHAHAIYKLSYTGPVAGAKDEALARAVDVFPVPANGYFMIQLKDLKSREVEFVLTNPQSANVLMVTKPVREGTNSYKLDTSRFANGVYFLRILSGGAQVVKRIIIRNK